MMTLSDHAVIYKSQTFLATDLCVRVGILKPTGHYLTPLPAKTNIYLWGKSEEQLVQAF
jgi:hypothetical protein